MSAMGVFTGVLVILFAGFTSAMGLYFLSRCALRIERGHSSFNAVAKRTYPHAAIFFDGAIAIKCFGISLFIKLMRCCGVISYYNRRFNASSHFEFIPQDSSVFSPRSTILDNDIYVFPV
jgi:hypothetical protein